MPNNSNRTNSFGSKWEKYNSVSPGKTKGSYDLINPAPSVSVIAEEVERGVSQLLETTLAILKNKQNLSIESSASPVEGKKDLESKDGLQQAAEILKDTYQSIKAENQAAQESFLQKIREAKQKVQTQQDSSSNSQKVLPMKGNS